MDSNYYQRAETARQNFLNNLKKTVVINCDAKTFEDLVNSFYKNDKHTDDYKLPEHAFLISFTVPAKEFSEEGLKLDSALIDNGHWPLFVHQLLDVMYYNTILPGGEYLFSVDK